MYFEFGDLRGDCDHSSTHIKLFPVYFRRMRRLANTAPAWWRCQPSSTTM